MWGGTDGASTTFRDGGRYDPASDTWKPVTSAGAPSARSSARAVWTGSRVIVWGGAGIGEGGSPPNTGGVYDPDADSWTATSTTGAPSGRYSHVAVWTGTEMLVWGGTIWVGYRNDGGRYNPATNTWAPISTTNAPRWWPAGEGVWAGNRMVVFGGFDWGYNQVQCAKNEGGIYDPATNSWVLTTASNAPTPRATLAMAWTGSRVLVWGGFTGCNPFNDIGAGALFDPVANSWSPIITINAPSPRSKPWAAWTGAQFIVWDGYDSATGGPSGASGARYTPP